jgi:2-polyprenyl-3-methyl-5-hydroxy-6-metoxy-1,4-benzoquinol methylase
MTYKSLPFIEVNSNDYYSPLQILDIGCSIGHGALHLAVLKPDAVTFVDLSSESLLETERRFRRIGHGKYMASFMPCDASVYLPPPNALQYYTVRRYATHENLLRERQAQKTQQIDGGVQRNGTLKIHLPSQQHHQASHKSVNNEGENRTEMIPLVSLTSDSLNPRYYNFITCYYVLQHCSSNDALYSLIANMAAVLNPNGGKIACIIPNAERINYILNHPELSLSIPCRLWWPNPSTTQLPSSTSSAVKFYNFQTKPPLGRIYHERLIFQTELLEMLEQNGLQVLQNKPLSAFLNTNAILSDGRWRQILQCESATLQASLPFLIPKMAAVDNPCTLPESLYDLFTLLILGKN